MIAPARLVDQLDAVAAVVVWSPDKTEAAVYHPGGPAHENAVNTAARLRARGVRVVDVTNAESPEGD
jgi:hypothetical protein